MNGKSRYTNESVKNQNETFKYPLIGASKLNNGIVEYFDTYDYENEFYTLVNTGDGSSDALIKQNEKFNKINTVWF